MKKRLVILPLLALASGVLASCGDDPKKPVGPSDEKLAPASWTDSDGKTHARVSTVEDGKSYYLCYYRATEDEMRVANGEPHKDKNKEYPFYIGTSTVDSGEQVAVKISYTDATHFTMQFDGEGCKWDQKYISIYMAESSYGNKVYSVHAADVLGEDFEDEDGEVSTCYYEFEIMSQYDDYTLGVPVINFTDDRIEEASDEPKFLGSGVDGNGVGYISIDCTNAIKAMDSSYNLAFFYEV